MNSQQSLTINQSQMCEKLCCPETNNSNLVKVEDVLVIWLEPVVKVWLESGNKGTD